MNGLTRASTQRTGFEAGCSALLCWCSQTLERARFPMWDESGAPMCARCGGRIAPSGWTDLMQRKQSQLMQFGLARGTPLLARWRRRE